MLVLGFLLCWCRCWCCWLRLLGLQQLKSLAVRCCCCCLRRSQDWARQQLQDCLMCWRAADCYLLLPALQQPVLSFEHGCYCLLWALLGLLAMY